MRKTFKKIHHSQGSWQMTLSSFYLSLNYWKQTRFSSQRAFDQELQVAILWQQIWRENIWCTHALCPTNPFFFFVKSAQKIVCFCLEALLASNGFLCVPLGVFVCAHWLTFEKQQQESTYVCLMLWLFVVLPRSCNSNPCIHLFVLAYNHARVCKFHGY